MLVECSAFAALAVRVLGDVETVHRHNMGEAQASEEDKERAFGPKVQGREPILEGVEHSQQEPSAGMKGQGRLPKGG